MFFVVRSLKTGLHSSINMSAIKLPKVDSSSPSLILKDSLEYPITFSSFFISSQTLN